jgi:hypothetical protein
VLRKTYGHEKDELYEEFMIVHNEELYDLHRSIRIVRIVTSESLKCAGYMARMGRGNGYPFQNFSERIS